MKNEELKKGEIVIYKAKGGPIIDVRLQQDTVWLSQKEMALLFDKDLRTVNEHIKNIYQEKELDIKPTIRKFRIVQKEGQRTVERDIDCYNLDAIISVGYRVKSLRGTQFRIWATNVLRRHLVDGYTINEQRLKAQQSKILELQETVRLLGNIVQLEAVSDEAKGIVQIISEYTRALNLLDDYDHQKLIVPKGTKKTKYTLTYEESMSIIEQMKKKFRDSAIVGQEKD